MRFSNYAAVILFALVVDFGCSGPNNTPTEPGKPSEPATEKTAARTIESVWPSAPKEAGDAGGIARGAQVSDDAKEIAKVKALFQKQTEERFSNALESIRKGDWPGREGSWALKQKKDKAVEELTQIMEGESDASEKGRVRAAVELSDFDPVKPTVFLLGALKNSNAKLRAAALDALNFYDARIDWSNTERRKTVLDLIDDPNAETSREAVWLCVGKHIEGTEAKLAALLKEKRSPNPVQTAEKLAEVATTPESIELVVQALFKDRTKDAPRINSYCLEKLLANPDKSLTEPVRAAYLEYLSGFDKKERGSQPFIRMLAVAADRSTIPELEEILVSSKDPVSRSIALEALAKFDPETAADRVFDYLSKNGVDAWEVRLLRPYVNDDTMDSAIALLTDPGHGQVAHSVSLPAVKLLVEKCGEDGEEAVLKAWDRLEPDAKLWSTWRKEEFRLEEALAELKSSGVISTSSGVIIAKMRNARKKLQGSDDLDPTDGSTLLEALGSAGIVTIFDAETDSLPCYHDFLIFEFSEATNGGFVPEAAVQSWNGKKEDDPEGFYTVKFIYKNRLYRFDAEYRSDWYDVEAVSNALNFALETSGSKQRFIPLASDGQIAEFVFADPSIFLSIAEKYAIPVSPDADDAVLKGKAFEQKVIDRLRASEE